MLTFDSGGTPGTVSVDDVLKKAQERHLKRQEGDFAVANASDLHLDYEPLTKNYWAKFNGEQYMLSPHALRSACSLIGTSKTYFDGFIDPQEFIRQFVKRVDAGVDSGKNAIKMIMRTTRLNSHNRIDAILPTKYQIVDDYELLLPVIERMDANNQKIHGISTSSHGGETSYRILYGEPIADAKQLKVHGDVVNSVVHLHNDELGPECGMSLGNWRGICSNVCLASSWKSLGTAVLPESMQTPGIRWNHISAPKMFFGKAAELLKNSDHYNYVLRKRLPESMNTKIDIDPGRLVEYLSVHQLIPKTAKNRLLEQMKCEQIENEWEWVNVNTFVAQKFEPKTRRSIESLAHAVLLNGFERLTAFLDGDKKSQNINMN